MKTEELLVFEKFDSPQGSVERIRLNGHRISIEHVLAPYKEGITPEEIVGEYYPTLSIEQVNETIAYYLHNREAVDEYLRHTDELAKADYQEHVRKGDSPVVKRMKDLKAADDWRDKYDFIPF
jgi:uncharacterized protein (DUF433 family)